MSNVFSNASFAVLSVMKSLDASNTKVYRGSTVFVQRKPEADFGNITVISYSDDRFGTDHTLRVEDFDQQAAFEANVVPKIATDIKSMISDRPVVIANSNISANSYTMSGTAVS
jgi:hypothetical protein